MRNRPYPVLKCLRSDLWALPALGTGLRAPPRYTKCACGRPLTDHRSQNAPSSLTVWGWGGMGGGCAVARHNTGLQGLAVRQRFLYLRFAFRQRTTSRSRDSTWIACYSFLYSRVLQGWRVQTRLLFTAQALAVGFGHGSENSGRTPRCERTSTSHRPAHSAIGRIFF